MTPSALHELPATPATVHRDDAYSFMSVAVDFTVTPVVDGRQGVHGRIDKRCFPRFVRAPS